MKLSFLPVIILLLVLGCVDLVSSDLVCLVEGAACGGGLFSCCADLECSRESQGGERTCKPPPTPAPSQAPSQSQEPSKSIEPSQSPSQSVKPSQSVEPSQEPSQEPTRQPTLTGRWKTITHDTFDNGWGSLEKYYFIPGTEDYSKRTDNGRYIYKGVHALRMKKTSGVKHKDGHDVSDYEKLRVRMWIYPQNLTSSDELLLFLKKDGKEWQEVDKFRFLSNNWFREVSFTKDIENVEKVQIALVLEADTEDEKVFIDEIHVEGYKSEVMTPWSVITSDDFEDGWGSFTSVGNDGADDQGDAIRMSNLKSNQRWFVPEGNAALRIREEGRKSSVFHKDGHDLTGYSRCQVNFQFSARKVDQDYGFVLQYSSNNGTDWTKVKKYIKKGKEDPEDGGIFYFRNVRTNDGYWNDRFYSDTVVLKGDDYNLTTTNARICFRSKAKTNEYIYIDKVKFRCRE